MGAKMQQGRHLEADPWTLVMKKVSKKGQSPEAVATTYSEHTGLKPFEYLEAPPGMEGFSSDSGDKISTDIGCASLLIFNISVFKPVWRGRACISRSQLSWKTLSNPYISHNSSVFDML